MNDNKTYYPQIAEMLGVEFGEEFETTANFRNPYRFTHEGLINREGSDSTYMLDDLLRKNVKAKRIPYEPKAGSSYFYVTPSGSILSATNTTSAIDLYCVNSGNCFRSIAEAERNIPAMMEMFATMKNE